MHLPIRAYAECQIVNKTLTTPRDLWFASDAGMTSSTRWIFNGFVCMRNQILAALATWCTAKGISATA